jgi:hypothetical protein
MGRCTFISTDGILRDAGSLHGHAPNEEVLSFCAELMIGYLSTSKIRQVLVFLDAPVSHSVRHCHMIRNMMVKAGLNGACEVTRSADHALKSILEGVLATSDTIIIDNVTLPVTDLARNILEDHYSPHFVMLTDIIPDLK